MAAGGLALGAVATAIVTGLYQRSATRALQRALLWHNANFSR